MTFVLAVIPYKMWLGGTRFDGGTVLLKGVFYICIAFKELSESGYSQDVDWGLWIEHISRDYVEMVYISIAGKYQACSTDELCLGGQYLRYFKNGSGGSKFSNKQFTLVSDDYGGRIVHYKWNSICILWKGIVLGANGCGKTFYIKSWHVIVLFPRASDILDGNNFIIYWKQICTKTYQPETDEASKNWVQVYKTFKC